MSLEDLYTISEASEVSGLPEDALRYLARLGIISAEKAGGQWFLPPDSVGAAAEIAEQAAEIAEENEGYDEDETDGEGLSVKRLELELNPPLDDGEDDLDEDD